MLYPLAFFGILANSMLALVVLLALLGRLDVPLLSGLKQSPFQPLAVALGLHWFFYFGPINFGAVLINSEVQRNYAWIVRKPLIAQASLASLIAYPLLLLVLAGLAWWLRDSPLARRWRGLPVVPANQLLVVAALMAVMAVLIAPYITTRSADAGAFYEKVPLFFNPFVKGLFPLEAIPLLAASLRVFSLPRPAAADGEAPRYIAVAGLQIFTFILLRQRFLTLLAVVLASLVMARWLRRRQIVVGVPIGLLLAYAIPTALRFGRFPPRPGQPLADYLALSTRNFLGGLLPGQMIHSALNDFSYNKAGFASISVLLDLRQADLLRINEPFGWLPPEIFRVFPASLKARLPEWGSHGAEALVSRALGVGGPGWTNWGLPEVIPKDFVIDMMETPWLNAVANGGFLGVVVFALITGLAMAALWWVLCHLFLWRRWTWALPFGALFVVGQGPSWFGDLLVMVKVSLPWLLLCASVAAYSRWSHSARTTQRQ